MTKWLTHNINKEVILSKGFLLALFILLLNDYVLKETFSNDITGKLSDFSGVFLFVLFFSSISSFSAKTISWVTVVIFAYWKSSLSTPFINFWNLYLPDIARVVDYYDLFALVMAPLATIYMKNIQKKDDEKLLFLPTLLIATFAITGTSAANHKSPIYTANSAKVERQVSLLKKVDELASKENWVCTNCEVGKTSRTYEAPFYHYISFNYDELNAQLFYQVNSRNDKPEYRNEVVNKIQAYFKNEGDLVVIKNTGKTWASRSENYRWYMSMEGDSQGGIGTKIKNFFSDTGENEELNKVFQFVNDYFASKGYSYRTYGIAKNSHLSRYYYVGKVMGPNDYDTSTHISVGLRGGWLVTHFYIEIEQYQIDSSVPVKDMAIELEKKLRAMVSKNIEIETQPLP